jgi:hypothetical protein
VYKIDCLKPLTLGCNGWHEEERVLIGTRSKGLFEGLLAGDRAAAGEVVESLARSMALPAIYLNVLSPVMVQIGIGDGER